jgi:hypothetical protein
LWNLKVHNHVHSSPPFVPILNHIVHSLPSYPISYSKISILFCHLCVYFPGVLPPGFLLKQETNCSCLSSRPHALPITSSSSRSTVQYLVWIKNHEFLSYVIFSVFIHRRPRYIPRYPVIKHPQHMSFGNVKVVHLPI